MNLENCTQTLDGTPVKIYKVYENEIHGAYFDTYKWVVAVWDKEGNYLYGKYLNGMCSYHTFPLNLKDWSKDIPWHILKDEIIYVAMDETGEWFGYEEPEPERDEVGWYNNHAAYSLEAIKTMPKPHDWKNSLVKRPNSGEKR